MTYRDLNYNNPLISIVSPCYNSEKWVGRMLDSVLAQTYKNIEVICVDDGSADNTGSIIASYSDVFKENGMKLVCINQSNNGFVSAINKGLQHVNGEYISYLDSDDFLVDKCVEKRVAALEGNKDFAVVANDFYTVDEADIHNPIERFGERFGSLNFQPHQFYLALTGMSIMWTGSYMIRTECFDSVHTGRQINPCPVGQNYQTLFPLYYRYKRLYIDEPLSYYVIRKNSDYHREKTAGQWEERRQRLLIMLDEVLNTLDMPEWETRKCRRLSFLNCIS